MTPTLDIERLGVREILDSLADGAYVTDKDRRIIFWNRSAEQITGWKASDIVGHSCGDNILVHTDRDGHELCGKKYCPLHRAMITGARSAEAMLVFAKKKSGERVPVEVTVAPLRNGNGEVVGGIEIFRNMTGMMDDLWRAKRIQSHAMESSLPNDPRIRFDVCYVPQEMVGGDFYHIEPIGPSQYGLMVADFMGHGVAAALYCMQLRSLWEDLRDELGKPAHFMSLINDRFCRLVQADGYFATAVYAVIDLAEGTIRSVRSGHVAPVMLHCNGAVRRVGVPAPALGLFSGTQYVEMTDPMGIGDTLVVFTDGATEVTDRTDHEFGEDALIKLLQDNQTESGKIRIDRLEQHITEYCSQIRLADDLTMLVARRTG